MVHPAPNTATPQRDQSVLAAPRSPKRRRTEALAGFVVALASTPEAISFSIIAPRQALAKLTQQLA